MIRPALQKIGLTDGEIRVYTALLALGETTTGPLTRHSRISGSKVYEVLGRLQEKGLAASVEKNGVLHFSPSPPERILGYLDERKQEIEEEKRSITDILPQLMDIQSDEKTKVRVFTGFAGIKTANEDIISTLGSGEEWLSMGLTDQPEAWEKYFTRRQRFRAEKGIIQRHLLNVKYAELYEARQALPHTEFRFLPESFAMPTSTEIYRNRVIIMILLQKDPLAIMIESKPVSQSFRRYFELLWAVGKTYKQRNTV